jgi:hypothetical protein
MYDQNLLSCCAYKTQSKELTTDLKNDEMMKSAAILTPSIARARKGALSHTSVAKAITARFMSGINAPGEEKMVNTQVLSINLRSNRVTRNQETSRSLLRKK